VLWGCHHFADYYKKDESKKGLPDYCLGNLDRYMVNTQSIYEKVRSNYSQLSSDRFRTDEKICGQCDDLLDCHICPMFAAFASGEIGRIPNWMCHTKQIIRREADQFRMEFMQL
jgi:hypothetical protein